MRQTLERDLYLRRVGETFPDRAINVSSTFPPASLLLSPFSRFLSLRRNTMQVSNEDTDTE